MLPFGNIIRCCCFFLRCFQQEDNRGPHDTNNLTNQPTNQPTNRPTIHPPTTDESPDQCNLFHPTNHPNVPKELQTRRFGSSHSLSPLVEDVSHAVPHARRQPLAGRVIMEPELSFAWWACAVALNGVSFFQLKELLLRRLLVR